MRLLAAWHTGGIGSVAGERHYLTVDEALVAVLVVTHETVGAAELEVGDGLLQRLPELLLTHDITDTD